MRLAVKATGRSTVVVLEGSFHGRTAAASAITWGSDKWYAYPNKPVTPRFVPVDDPAVVRDIDRPGDLAPS